MALVSASSAQTDVGCRQQQFGKFSEWSTAVNLGPGVNSQFREFWPAISPNGLSLYSGSVRPGGSLEGAMMTDRKRPPVVIWIIQLLAAFTGFYRVTQSPSFGMYRTVDIVNSSAPVFASARLRLG